MRKLSANIKMDTTVINKIAEQNLKVLTNSITHTKKQVCLRPLKKVIHNVKVVYNLL